MMSSACDNIFYRLYFRLRIYEAHGVIFQNLVNQVLDGKFESFQAVAPYGSQGDGGNDGYIPSENHYFQVYGPQPNTQLNPARAVKKAQEDFKKLQKNYPNMKKYSFVLNDRFQGVPATIIQTLDKLSKDNCIETHIITSGKLLEYFQCLPNTLKNDIINAIPSSLPQFVDASAVGELLQHIAKIPIPLSLVSKRSAPDFDEKLRFNKLSEMISTRLSVNSYQHTIVANFFDTGDQWHAQNVAQSLHALYQEGRSKFSNMEEAADLCYMWMLEEMIPGYAKAHPHTLKAFRDAAEIIISYFFESCDVYEKPSPCSSSA